MGHGYDHNQIYAFNDDDDVRGLMADGRWRYVWNLITSTVSECS